MLPFERIEEWQDDGVAEKRKRRSTKRGRPRALNARHEAVLRGLLAQDDPHATLQELARELQRQAGVGVGVGAGAATICRSPRAFDASVAASADPGQHRRRPLARLAAHLRDVAPASRHADLRASAARWLKDWGDGGTLGPRRVGGTPKRRQSARWIRRLRFGYAEKHKGSAQTELTP